MKIRDEEYKCDVMAWTCMYYYYFYYYYYNVWLISYQRMINREELWRNFPLWTVIKQWDIDSDVCIICFLLLIVRKAFFVWFTEKEVRKSRWQKGHREGIYGLIAWGSGGHLHAFSLFNTFRGEWTDISPCREGEKESLEREGTIKADWQLLSLISLCLPSLT